VFFQYGVSASKTATAFRNTFILAHAFPLQLQLPSEHNFCTKSVEEVIFVSKATPSTAVIFDCVELSRQK
jgi:hypothetical protein